MPKKKDIESYAHTDKERTNNPPVGLVTPETDRDQGKKVYAHDPISTRNSSGPARPSIRRSKSRRLAARSRAHRCANGHRGSAETQWRTAPAFVVRRAGGNPPLRQAIEFYRHKHNWSNRLVAGDSLLVMNSLLEKEGLGGQVQMIYIDPPYGISYGSNFSLL